MSSDGFSSFTQFYPHYLSEHQNRTCRLLHVIGSSLVLLELIALCTLQPTWYWWLSLPLTGYGFAWVGHFFFEKNRPATFTYPLWSLMGDWVMFAQIVTRRLPLNPQPK